MEPQQQKQQRKQLPRAARTRTQQQQQLDHVRDEHIIAQLCEVGLQESELRKDPPAKRRRRASAPLKQRAEDDLFVRFLFLFICFLTFYRARPMKRLPLSLKRRRSLAGLLYMGPLFCFPPLLLPPPLLLVLPLLTHSLSVIFLTNVCFVLFWFMSNNHFRVWDNQRGQGPARPSWLAPNKMFGFLFFPILTHLQCAWHMRRKMRLKNSFI